MVLVWFALGIISGSIVTNIIWYIKSSSGCLKIDHSNPDKDVYRLELGTLDNLTKKKRIILKVDKNADLSQK